MNRYYYGDGLREFGPFTVTEMMDKKLRPDFKVREANEVEMKPISEHPELRFIVGNNKTFPAESEFKRLDEKEEESAQAPRLEKDREAWRDPLLFGAVVLLMFVLILRFILNIIKSELEINISSNVYLILRILTAFTPLLIALGIQKKIYRIPGLILAIVLVIANLYAAWNIFSIYAA
ncbi:hypothetical protein [Nonlabens antarcticus]|uniref:hypothetical protein n=1 Tax=Nonlabens antarcticus TaxID=392714 RepID=UPI001890EC37|nr:hypothetical protein [Nonlabens antarcticus]